jgi:hypothetical protein
VSVGDGCPLLGKALLQVDQSTAVIQLAVPSFHVQAKLAAYAAGAPAQTNTKFVIHAGSKPARARARGRPAAGTGLRRSPAARGFAIITMPQTDLYAKLHDWMEVVLGVEVL